MKKINNWKLLAFLGILVLVFFTVRYFRSPGLRTNLPDLLVEIDTSKVTELIIIPAKERDSEIHLVRQGKSWELREGDRTGHIQQGGVRTALQSLLYLKPESIVTKKKESWGNYQVDSTGTHVRLLNGGSAVADLWIGKTGFSQSSVGEYGGGYTYVRLEGKNEVYTINFFLEGEFNRGFDDWRDKGFCRIKSDSIDRVTFLYPADSSFVLEKKTGRWTIGGIPADSTKVKNYLLSMEFKNLPTFAAVPAAGTPAMIITFENKGREISKLEAWSTPGAWTLRSSLQQDTWFLSEPETTKEIWKSRNELIIK